MQRWLVAGVLTGMIAGGGWLLLQGRLSSPQPKLIRLEVPVAQPRETILATYEKVFKCTVYYSPKESGFTSEGGFDLTPETKPGLEDQRYPRDFLKAVELEGFGRIKTPVSGKLYLRYWSNKWGYAEQPIDNHQRPLIPKQSCAIAKPHELVAPNAKLSIRCPGVTSAIQRSSLACERYRQCFGAASVGLILGRG